MLDLSVVKQKHRYAIEFKTASEGRGDRLIPLLAQAILEAQAKGVYVVLASGRPHCSLSSEPLLSLSCSILTLLSKLYTSILFNSISLSRIS